jgi:hypothetical protein
MPVASFKLQQRGETMQCFEDGAAFDQFDCSAFKFKHKLVGHPALSLENLARTIPSLPKERVMYSTRRLKNGDDFESTFKVRPAERSIEETIENIRVSDSFVIVSSPELHPSFAPLRRELIADVEALMRRRGVGTQAVDPELYLFIASPNSVTPFHIDRYSTFLMQFRGSKEVAVFPQWDERVVSDAHRAAYVMYANSRLPWSPERDALGTRFEFHPGEALHIPFVAGHHVRNGSEDVSISMSIIFNTQQSMAWRRALSFNHSSRRVLSRFGMAPAPVGPQPWRDAAKANLWQAVKRFKSALK